MEFIRQIVNSDALKPVLALPPSFQNVQVEVIVLPVDSRNTNVRDYNLVAGPEVSVKAVKHTAFGRLKTYANPSLMQEEETAWEKAVTEKYAPH